jgi:predicted ArsR family transcriptional regulator
MDGADNGIGSSLVVPEPRRSDVQVVARVAEVLRALAAGPHGLSLSELALSVDLSKSAVHRLVSALESEGFAATGPSGRVRLGRGIARLQAATRDGRRDQLGSSPLRLQRQLDGIEESLQTGDLRGVLRAECSAKMQPYSKGEW